MLKINLLPALPQKRQWLSRLQVWNLVAVTLVIFTAGFYWGYLCQKIAHNEAKLRQIKQETSQILPLYYQTETVSTALVELNNKDELSKVIDATYQPALNVLENLVKVKPKLL